MSANVLRPDPHREGLLVRLRRRQLLRLGMTANVLLFLGAFGGFFTGVGAAVPGFFRPIKYPGIGGLIEAGKLDEILNWFKTRNDEPMLVQQGRFFLLHTPDNGVIAAFRRCTHLGCTVPWNSTEDQFHCPCHGSLFHKNTGVVKGGPAPRALDLFPIQQRPDGSVVVDTTPTEGNLKMDRSREFNTDELTKDPAKSYLLRL